MKKYLLYAIPLLLAAGCAKEIPAITEPEDIVYPEPAVEMPEATVIHAIFEDPVTKSHIEMNEAGTHAGVYWDLEDKMVMRAFISENSYYPKEFTAISTDSSGADFECYDWNPPEEIIKYLAFYPADLYRGKYASLGAYIPSEQTAVPNGIAKGLNISYAVAESLEEDLVFHNIPALLKFKLSGDVVNQLSAVKFISNSSVAGDFIIEDLDDGNPTYNFSSYYLPQKESPSRSVTLNAPEGGFEPDVDYYMAMFPGTTEGFNMVFLDNDGDYIIKTSSKSLTLNRSRITDFGTIAVGSSFGDPLVTKYMSKATGSKPVDIVVLPDGFTSDQREEFESLARSGINFMFETEPYKSLKDYFNVYFIWAASQEKGASVSDKNDNITTKVNTAFNSRWGEDFYDNMVADEDKVYGYVTSHCPEIVRGELTINEVPILLIINDTRYGGRAHSTSSGRTYCQVPLTYGGDPISWGYPSTVPVADTGTESRARTDEDLAEVGVNEGDWRNTLLHEFGGHSFGRLKDEYWYTTYYTEQSAISHHSWTVPFGLNVSGYYETVPWQDLLDRKANLVSRNALYNRIGIYQGGDVSIFNRWRSEKISCMIDNRQYFSAWQRVLIAKRITELAGETFDLDVYLSYDDPTDPVRDVTATLRGVNSRGPVKVMPPLAPPELIEDDQQVGLSAL